MTDPQTLKAQLRHTWSAFFMAHGNFTEVQRQAMGVILEGHDTLIVAATASGKTEAALVPLLERHTTGEREAGLKLIYLCPTRALVRDLFERLKLPLGKLGITLAMKSGDTAPVSTRRPPEVLITTPESTDALLTRAPRLFTTLRALVIDEVHLFDNSPRGDHVRCLLGRIETIRHYANPQGAALQRVALSATIADPAATAARYMNAPVVVQVTGGRRLEADVISIYDLEDVVTALAKRAAAKTLVFCNTRNEVEEVASYIRQALPFEAQVFVHYSNLDPALRREVEARFAEAAVAICVSSSTLELGIDIGSIDEVALVGAPPTLSSFLQRVGRGGRRGTTSNVLCLSRSPKETLQFEALLEMSRGERMLEPLLYTFRLSVLIQQTFSLLKQSPTGGVKPADLQRIAPPELHKSIILDLLRHLAFTDYLTTGRPGEWRSGVKLNELADEHDIYSNIGGEALGATIIDAYSGRPIAQADRPRYRGERLLMGGAQVEVAWQDRYRVGVEKKHGTTDDTMRFHTAPVAIPPEITLGIARRMGVPQYTLLLLPHTRGMWLFHFWGDHYGKLLARLLEATRPDADAPKVDEETGERLYHRPEVSVWNELCLYLPYELSELPPYDAGLIEEEVTLLAKHFMRSLELGRFANLLPPKHLLGNVQRGLDLARFEWLYRNGKLELPEAEMRVRLQGLL